MIRDAQNKNFMELKDDEKMIAITLSEKKAICEKYPDVHIVRTMKQDSKRHHYYMVEDRAPMRYLNTLRGLDKPKSPKGKRKDV